MTNSEETQPKPRGVAAQTTANLMESTIKYAVVGPTKPMGTKTKEAVSWMLIASGVTLLATSRFLWKSNGGDPK